MSNEMMNENPFFVEPQKKRIFGALEIEWSEPQISQFDGRKYWWVTIRFIPFNGSSIERRMPTYDPAWYQVLQPSIKRLAQKYGQNVTAYEWAAFEWQSYLDSKKGTIDYYEKNNPDKIQYDVNDKPYVEKMSFNFVDVYSSENDALAAHDAYYNIENGYHERDEIPGFETEEPATDDSGKATAAMFLPSFVKQAMKGNAVDRDQLAGIIAGDEMLSKHFTIESDEVLEVIQKIEAAPAF